MNKPSYKLQFVAEQRGDLRHSPTSISKLSGILLAFISLNVSNSIPSRGQGSLLKRKEFRVKNPDAWPRVNTEIRKLKTCLNERKNSYTGEHSKQQSSLDMEMKCNNNTNIWYNNWKSNASSSIYLDNFNIKEKRNKSRMAREYCKLLVSNTVPQLFQLYTTEQINWITTIMGIQGKTNLSSLYWKLFP